MTIDKQHFLKHPSIAKTLTLCLDNNLEGNGKEEKGKGKQGKWNKMGKSPLFIYDGKEESGKKEDRFGYY